MGKWLARLLFDWVFVLLCRLMQGLLKLVDFMESFFDIFAGTSKVMYKDSGDFLINIFFGHDAVTNAFWAMALIAIVMAFGFCIVEAVGGADFFQLHPLSDHHPAPEHHLGGGDQHHQRAAGPY